MTDEQRWIARAQQGDTAAFEALVNAYALFVYNLALRMVRNKEEAEDLAQTAFLRAWQGLARFRGDAHFQTWLYRIVINLCYNRLPQLRHELINLRPDEAALSATDAHQEVEAAYLSEELRLQLHAAIDRLPESYRLLITLRYLQEMSYNEIAEVVGMPLGTVKTGIHRARGLLRETLEQYRQER